MGKFCWQGKNFGLKRLQFYLAIELIGLIDIYTRLDQFLEELRRFEYCSILVVVQ